MQRAHERVGCSHPRLLELSMTEADDRGRLCSFWVVQVLDRGLDNRRCSLQLAPGCQGAKHGASVCLMG